MKRRIITVATFCVLIVAAITYLFMFSSMARGKEKYVYVDEDDNIDSVYAKLKPITTRYSMMAFKLMAGHSGYKDNIKTGRYSIETGALQTFRHLRNGHQAPLSLTIPSVRTVQDLADKLSDKLMLSRGELLAALTDAATCKKYGYTPETILCIFIPNTYDVYWNIPVDKFISKMAEESGKFWNYERKEKAKAAGLTPVQVITLASIVDEETDYEPEMPMIAGMYLNRLHMDMPLQADPTVKFATKQFEAHRIYHNMLTVDSPYNTYKNLGLPPGPIRIPSVAAIDAVLNYVHHDYVYMCAKEDFSGRHNFAKTYAEHQVNAQKYAKALNERGIQ